MTMLPAVRSARKLGLVIDLDVCVGCHACAVNCKEWNSGGQMAPLTDRDPYGAKPSGVWARKPPSTGLASVPNATTPAAAAPPSENGCE